MRARDIIRNTAFIFLLSYLSGLFMGVFHLTGQTYLLLAVNYFCVFIGFCFVAHWSDENKLKFLMSVASLLWLLGAPEQLLSGYYKGWVFSGLALYLCAAGSWWLSRYFKKHQAEE